MRNAAATGVDDLGGGLALPPELAPTFETLFDEVEVELNANAKVDVTWDPMFGFPVHAYFDEGVEGDGFRWGGMPSRLASLASRSYCARLRGG